MAAINMNMDRVSEQSESSGKTRHQRLWLTREGWRKMGVDPVVIARGELEQVLGGFILHLVEDGRSVEYFLTHSEIERLEDFDLPTGTGDCNEWH